MNHDHDYTYEPRHKQRNRINEIQRMQVKTEVNDQRRNTLGLANAIVY